MKLRIACLFLVCTILLIFAVPISGADAAEDVALETTVSLDLACKSAILMDAETGTVLYEQNADEALPPASVTKIMTLLLVMEAVESGAIKLTDMVSVSANAASMGGSQIYLKEGEQMCVEELIKSVVIASANDAAVALAEFVAGSEETFVERMNARAKELNMTQTSFENTNGLDDTVEHHLTSARDIAIMSAQLIKHKKILEYSAIWMDTIRNGEFGLTNTNRLVRFYKGATGLKTGSTAKAKFCVSATAERDGMHLVCVIMGAETRDSRNAIATQLLDYGFANYERFHADGQTLNEIKVTGGVEDTCGIGFDAFDYIVKKGDRGKVEQIIELDESVAAPIRKGTEVGTVTYRIGEEILGSIPIHSTEEISKISFWELLERILAGIFLK